MFYADVYPDDTPDDEPILSHPPELDIRILSTVPLTPAPDIDDDRLSVLQQPPDNAVNGLSPGNAMPGDPEDIYVPTASTSGNDSSPCAGVPMLPSSTLCSSSSFPLQPPPAEADTLTYYDDAQKRKHYLGIST